MTPIFSIFLELTGDEIRNISQIVICSTIEHAKNVYAFTEQGVAMLSSVLRRIGFQVREKRRSTAAKKLAGKKG